MMSKSIKIKKSLSLDDIEEILKDINANKTIDLQLPISIDYTGFGILPSFFLAFFTWVRNNNGKIILPINENDLKKLEDFATDYYGYVILSTIWRNFDIVNKNNVNIKLSFKDFTGKMHQYIDSLTINLPNESILVPSYDHFPKEKGLSHWFYSHDNEFFNTPSGIENSIYHILSQINKNYKQRLKRNISDSFDDINTIVWELLKNTDEHATTDYLGQIKLLPNTRGLFMKIHRSSKNNFISNTKHEGLKEYYIDALDDDEFSFFLEISVFDSGPGLIKRFLGKEWSDDRAIEKNVDTIKNCLFKGQSSVKSNEGVNKGFGLDEVLNLLDKKRGFLKIRTGNVSVYKNLIKSKYKKFDNPSEIELFDWQSLSNENYTKMPTSEGSLVTLAIPLN